MSSSSTNMSMLLKTLLIRVTMDLKHKVSLNLIINFCLQTTNISKKKSINPTPDNYVFSVKAIALSKLLIEILILN